MRLLNEPSPIVPLLLSLSLMESLVIPRPLFGAQRYSVTDSIPSTTSTGLYVQPEDFRAGKIGIPLPLRGFPIPETSENEDALTTLQQLLKDEQDALDYEPAPLPRGPRAAPKSEFASPGVIEPLKETAKPRYDSPGIIEPLPNEEGVKPFTATARNPSNSSDGKAHPKENSNPTSTPDEKSIPVKETPVPVDRPAPLKEPIQEEKPIPVKEPVPKEKPAPVKELAPEEKPALVKDPVPAEKTAPVKGPVPVEKTAPDKGPVPVEKTAPVKEPIPVEKPAPAAVPPSPVTPPAPSPNLDVIPKLHSSPAPAPAPPSAPSPSFDIMSKLNPSPKDDVISALSPSPRYNGPSEFLVSTGKVPLLAVPLVALATGRVALNDRKAKKQELQAEIEAAVDKQRQMAGSSSSLVITLAAAAALTLAALFFSFNGSSDSSPVMPSSASIQRVSSQSPTPVVETPAPEPVKEPPLSLFDGLLGKGKLSPGTPEAIAPVEAPATPTDSKPPTSTKEPESSIFSGLFGKPISSPEPVEVVVSAPDIAAEVKSASSDETTVKDKDTATVEESGGILSSITEKVQDAIESKERK